MSELETLLITKEENFALNMMKGLESNAFYMVIGAKETEEGKFLLQGTPETFQALARDLYDEIEYELSPKSRLKHLGRLYCRLEPGAGEF